MYTQEQKQYIISEYEKGVIIPQIVINAPFNLSKSSIYHILRSNNVNLMRKTNERWLHLINEKFGYLTVVDIIKTNKSIKGSWRALCNCDCGKTNLDVAIQSLLRKRTTSCGCRRDQYDKIRGDKSILFKECGDISGKYWNQVNYRANKRNYKIEITIEYAWDLFLKQNSKCALSQLPICFVNANKKSSETTASLDRIDSTKGYVENNVQWVHKDINIMKNVFNQQYFIALCKHISKNN